MRTTNQIAADHFRRIKMRMTNQVQVLVTNQIGFTVSAGTPARAAPCGVNSWKAHKPSPGVTGCSTAFTYTLKHNTK